MVRPSLRTPFFWSVPGAADGESIQRAHAVRFGGRAAFEVLVDESHRTVCKEEDRATGVVARRSCLAFDVADHIYSLRAGSSCPGGSGDSLIFQYTRPRQTGAHRGPPSRMFAEPTHRAAPWNQAARRWRWCSTIHSSVVCLMETGPCPNTKTPYLGPVSSFLKGRSVPGAGEPQGDTSRNSRRSRHSWRVRERRSGPPLPLPSTSAKACCLRAGWV